MMPDVPVTIDVELEAKVAELVALVNAELDTALERLGSSNGTPAPECDLGRGHISPP
jgi:hypothetical protein